MAAPAFVGLLLLTAGLITTDHRPINFTWTVLSEVGDVIWTHSTVSQTIPWPTLTPDLCKMALGSPNAWGLGTIFTQHTTPEIDLHDSYGEGGCYNSYLRSYLQSFSLYVAPGHHRPRSLTWKCGGVDSYFSASWGCETTGDVYWKPSSSWDYITLKANYTHPQGAARYEDNPKQACKVSSPSFGWCHPLIITFTAPGKQQPYGVWSRGVQWAVRAYGGSHVGVLFTIKLQKTLPVTTLHSSRADPPLPPVPPSVISFSSPVPALVTLPPPPSPPLTTTDLVLNLVKGTFNVLNSSSPNLTQSCWLCVHTLLPLYDGMAQSLPLPFNTTTDYTHCPWSQCPNISLPIPYVLGSGTCLHTPNLSNSSMPPTLCENSVSVNPSLTGSYYLLPQGYWWACHNSLTACASVDRLLSSPQFCVPVRLFPRISYRPAPDFDASLASSLPYPHRTKREPITGTAISLALLLGVGATGAGTGIAALVQGNAQYEILRSQLDKDIQNLERGITALEKFLVSLSEVVLQNRRGLDLLLLKEGGLCAALREECCFYTDHTGVTRDSMAKVRESLEKRKNNRGMTETSGWFFSHPWLSSILPSILGPLVGLLLLLSFGPWLFKKLTTFIKEQIDSATARPIQVRYHRLALEDQDLPYDRPLRPPPGLGAEPKA